MGRTAALVLGLAAAVLLALVAGAEGAWEWHVGEIDFATSTSNQDAQALFNRGVALLHNFWYEEAIEHFREARALDPKFAMSYWGEAFSCKQGLWETEQYEQGKRVIEELNKLQGYPTTEREEMLLEAVRVIFGPGTIQERDLKFSQEMEKIYNRYPSDIEIASFHVLAMLTLVGSERGMLERGATILPKADAILQDILDVEPNHPGALHYRIHNLDTPQNGTSSKALDAARRYGPAAPTSPHAVHMPCHTYIRAGLWKEAMLANELSINAADIWVAHRNYPITFKDYHSIEYQQYVYLNQGRFWAGMQYVDLNFVVAHDLDSYYHYVRGTLMEARQLVEAHFWTLSMNFSIPLTPPARITCPTCESPAAADGFYLTTIYANTAAYFARGLVAATKRDSKLANECIAFLESEAEKIYPIRPPHGDNTMIMAQQIRGVLLFETGNVAQGLQELQEAFTWETKIDPPKDGPPQPAIPSFETYARYLLRAGNHQGALDVLASGNFTSSRNRAPTLWLMAKANEGLSRTADACAIFGQFVQQLFFHDVELQELSYAKTFLQTKCGGSSVQVEKEAAPKQGKEILPRHLQGVDTEREGPLKRQVLATKAWDWTNRHEASAHC